MVVPEYYCDLCDRNKFIKLFQHLNIVFGFSYLINKTMVKIFLFALIISFVLSSNFAPKTLSQVTEGFKKYDFNRDELLSSDELKRYFDEEYMKAFQGIEIDPRFLEASLEYLKSFDIDKNGHTLQQLIRGVIPDKSNGKKDKQPHHYSEQQL